MVSGGGAPLKVASAEPPSIWRLVGRRRSAIVSFNRGGSGIPLYCVHPISGDVTAYADLARFLGPEQPFYGIQVPKERMTVGDATSVYDIAARHVEEIVSLQPEGPLVLGGWSAGAIVALEMAQQLGGLGRDVPLLVALDGAPCNTEAGISCWNPLYGWKVACNLPRWLRDYQSNESRWQLYSGRLARRSVVSRTSQGDQTLNRGAVEGLLSKAGWLSEQVAFMSAFYDALRDYAPTQYRGRVLVYEARTQPLHRLVQVGAVWNALAERTEVVSMRGNHLNMIRRPVVETLAADLSGRLANVYSRL